MSDSNAVEFGIVEESTFGVTPTSPAFQTLRITGLPGLGAEPETVTSDEIRSDGQITDQILVGKTVGGDIGHELSFGALDVQLPGIMRSAFVNKATIVNLTADTEISDFLASTDTITVAAGGAAFVDQMLIEVTDVDADNNGIHEIASSTATTVVTTGTPGLTDQTTVPLGARIRAVGFIGASGDITATTVSGNALLSTTLDFTTMPLVVGDWVKVGGALVGEQFVGTAENNGYCRISAIAAGRLSFDSVPTGWATDAGSGKTIKVWFAEYIRNGQTKRSYAGEEKFTDHSPVTYQYLNGLVFDGFNFGFPSKDKVTVAATMQGADGNFTETRVSGATDIAAPSNTVLNTSSNVGALRENGAEITGKNYVLSSSISIANNVRMRPAQGKIEAVGFGLGRFNVTVDLETYFDDKTMVEKVTQNTQTSYQVAVQDSSNHAIMIDVPAMKFSGGKPDVSGPDADVFAPLAAQAIRHSTLGFTLGIYLFYHVE